MPIAYRIAGGLVAALDMLATVIRSFLLGKYLSEHTKRTLLVAGSVPVLAGNLLTAVFSGFTELAVIRRPARPFRAPHCSGHATGGTSND
jgi:hypothetical protein